MIAPLPIEIWLLVLSFCNGDALHILPPLSIVDRAVSKSTRTRRRRISVLRQPPFNMSKPFRSNVLSVADSVMVLIRACESGVSLPHLSYLDLCESISNAMLILFFHAIANGSMRALEDLSLQNNNISDPCMIALSEALGNGSLPALKKVVVQNDYENHPALVAACKPRGIEINCIEPVDCGIS